MHKFNDHKPIAIHRILAHPSNIVLPFLTCFILLIGLHAGTPRQCAWGQQRPLGIGLVIGNPTGFHLKYWKNRRNAFDAAAGWTLDENDAFQLHGDYLWHNFDITEDERTPIYYGLGVRIVLQGDEAGLGFRIPFGINHLLRSEPIDFFLELAPVIHFGSDAELNLAGGVGVRYYLEQ